MKHEVARWMLREKAVLLRPSKPFTWASGIRSPIYCDNRILLSSPKALSTLMRGFESLIRNQTITCDAIAGIATAGIPYASILADRLKKPLLYVRAKPKEHGRGNQIEGRLRKGSKVLVIEDLVSTGRSSLGAIGALRKAGAKVQDCLAIFSYGLKVSEKSFQKSKCRLHALTNLLVLLEEAFGEGYISKQEKNVIQKFSEDPERWSNRS